MKKANHYIITRFNVPSERWNERLKEKGITRKKWMENRIDLFKEYCLPSVLNQNNKNFVWVICISPNTEQEYKVLLKDIKSCGIKVELLEVPSLNLLTESLREFIRNDISQEESHIITSRLDNDDAIDRMYIDRVQREFKGQKFQPVLFSKGHQLILEKKSYVKEVVLPRGPFVNLIEDISEGISTVYERVHTKWIKEDIKLVNKKPFWVQILHGKNVRNSESIGLTVRKIDMRKKYGIKKEFEIDIVSYANKITKDVVNKARKKIFDTRKKYNLLVK
jgi:hypothetical protein